MRKNLFFSCLVAALSIIYSPAYAEGVGIGVKAGLFGVGVDVTSRLSNRLNARVGFSYLPIEEDMEEDDIDYEVDMKFRQFSLLLDYHPFAGNLRLTGGIVRNNTKWIFSATGEDDYDLDGITYSGDLTLTGNLSFQPVAPYLGIGFGNAVRPNKGLGFTFDLGFIATSTPDFNLEATGRAASSTVNDGQTEFDVTTNAGFNESLRREAENVEEDLEEFQILPVLMFGLSYQF